MSQENVFDPRKSSFFIQIISLETRIIYLGQENIRLFVYLEYLDQHFLDSMQILFTNAIIIIEHRLSSQINLKFSFIFQIVKTAKLNTTLAKVLDRKNSIILNPSYSEVISFIPI